MFLSKKWVLSIVAVTGLTFMILLVIQFGWIKTSVEVSRRHFADRMIIVSNTIQKAFAWDKKVQNFLSLPASAEDLFTANSGNKILERLIKEKVDSILRAEQLPVTSVIAGRIGHICYLMNEIPANLHSSEIDHSQYKFCLCLTRNPASLDIGLELQSSEMLTPDSSGLILPSVILILILIALFAYIIYIINRQKRLAELKNDFINNLTHEFNTPLFSIGIASNLLLKSEAVHQSEKLKGYVNLITTEKNRLLTQVYKILRLTAIESGGLILEKETVDMNSIIEQAIAGYRTAIEEKNGTIVFRKEGEPGLLTGDRVHLLNAISNLLDNAVKYSDRNPDIQITTANNDGGFIIIINDNGIGMTKADADMVFNKFYRAKKGDRHDVKGFGLGLSYVKKIVELHHGSVTVDSEPGKGSVFSIHLPYHS